MSSLQPALPTPHCEKLPTALASQKSGEGAPILSKGQPMKRLLALAWCILVAAPVAAQNVNKRALALDDMFRFQRIADPQISPDGKQVVYTVGTVDLDNNRVVHHLWIAATQGTTPPRQLTASAQSERHPRWSPDGTMILF